MSIRPAIPVLSVVALAAIAAALVFNEHSRGYEDADVFLALGRSLASGNGYMNTWTPEGSPANHFPIGYPAIVALVSLFSTSVIALKLLNVAFYLGSVLLSVLIFRRVGVSPLSSAIAGGVFALSGNALIYTSMVMSEMPYLLFSLLAIYCFLRVEWKSDHKKDAWLWFMFCALVCSFYIRTVGVALIVAIGITLVAERSWRRVGLFAMVMSSMLLVRVVAGDGSDGGYTKYLLWVDHQNPEKGIIGLWDLIVRVKNNALLYARFTLPEFLIPSLRPLLHNRLFILFIGMGLVSFSGYGLIRLGRFRKLFLLYVANYAIILLAWPTAFTTDRLLVPILPILALGLVNGFVHANGRITLSWVFAVSVGLLASFVSWSGQLYGIQNSIISLLTFATFLIALGLLGSREVGLRFHLLSAILGFLVMVGNLPEIVRLHDEAAGPIDSSLTAFREVGEWAKNQTAPSALFSSRRPYFLHNVSNRPSLPLPIKQDFFGGDFEPRPDTSPEEIFRRLNERRVNYLLYEHTDWSFGYYIGAALRHAPDRFVPVMSTSDSLITVYEFVPSTGNVLTRSDSLEATRYANRTSLER